jgi:hypothetical protein
MQHFAYCLHDKKIRLGILAILVNNKEGSPLLSTKHGFLKATEIILGNNEEAE